MTGSTKEDSDERSSNWGYRWKGSRLKKQCFRSVEMVCIEIHKSATLAEAGHKESQLKPSSGSCFSGEEIRVQIGVVNLVKRTSSVVTNRMPT